MNETKIHSIPISEIRVVNPRARDKIKFQLIVANIKAIGLKKPITVSLRNRDDDGTQYDLICGQGRMEAMIALGEQSIPAIVIDAPRNEQLLMSLVENIARRPPSNRDLIREVRELSRRHNKPDEIANKLGLDRTYIYGIMNLLEHGEESLIEAVEAGRLPITVALTIASGNGREIQQALAEAYEGGDLRGDKLKAAKRIIARRIKRQRAAGNGDQVQRQLTGTAVVKEYRDQILEQRKLIRRSSIVKDHLLLFVSAFRELLRDEHFITLLRAENLQDLPEQFAVKLK